MFTSPSALSFNLLTISPSHCLLPCHAVPSCHDWGLSRRSRCHTKFLLCSDRTAPRLELLPRTYTVHQSAQTSLGKIHTMNTSTNQSYKRTKQIATTCHNRPKSPSDYSTAWGNADSTNSSRLWTTMFCQIASLWEKKRNANDERW